MGYVCMPVCTTGPAVQLVGHGLSRAAQEQAAGSDSSELH